MADYDWLFRMYVLGDRGVGKTSLILRFAEDVHVEDVTATYRSEFRVRDIELGDKRVRLQLWDLLVHYGLMSAHCRGSHGIFIVYDVTNRSSFENVKRWLQEIDRYAAADVCRILVGNKCDCGSARVIEYDTGKEFADGLNIPFFETSARNTMNVEEAFMSMTELIEKRARNVERKPDGVSDRFVRPSEKKVCRVS